jgi:hypothetical protein
VAGAQGRKAATRHQSGSLVFGRPILRAIALTVFTVGFTISPEAWPSPGARARCPSYPAMLAWS